MHGQTLPVWEILAAAPLLVLSAFQLALLWVLSRNLAHKVGSSVNSNQTVGVDPSQFCMDQLSGHDVALACIRISGKARGAAGKEAGLPKKRGNGSH